MSISPVHGTADSERGKRFFFAFYEQWSVLLSLRTQNWIDFTFLKLQGEFAPYTGRWELEIGLLGLQVTITYVYDQSFNEEMRDMKGRIENELLGRTGATAIIDPTGALDKLGDGHETSECSHPTDQIQTGIAAPGVSVPPVCMACGDPVRQPVMTVETSAAIRCPRCGGTGVVFSGQYMEGKAGCMLCRGIGKVVQIGPDQYRPAENGS